MKIKNLGKRIGDMSDLPEELRSQISAGRSGNKDSYIIEIIRDLNGYASINEILAHLYHNHEIVEKRANLSNKIYRMVKTAAIFPVEKRRGVYTVSEEMAASISAADAGTRLGDLENMPDELKKQIGAGARGGKDYAVIQVINDLYDGVANIDEIMVGLFRKHGFVEKKPNIANRIYRMVRDGKIYSAKDRRGFYTTKKKFSEGF